MLPDEYIKNVLNTESNNFGDINTRLLSTKAIRLIHAGMGLNTEQAEFNDALKKFIFYGRPIDEINLKEEIGALFWYLGIAVNALNSSFEEIWETNIAKLKARYGEKFNEEGALSRNLNKERNVLEYKNGAVDKEVDDIGLVDNISVIDCLAVVKEIIRLDEESRNDG